MKSSCVKAPKDSCNSPVCTWIDGPKRKYCKKNTKQKAKQTTSTGCAKVAHSSCTSPCKWAAGNKRQYCRTSKNVSSRRSSPNASQTSSPRRSSPRQSSPTSSPRRSSPRRLSPASSSKRPSPKAMPSPNYDESDDDMPLDAWKAKRISEKLTKYDEPDDDMPLDAWKAKREALRRGSYNPHHRFYIEDID